MAPGVPSAWASQHPRDLVARVLQCIGQETAGQTEVRFVRSTYQRQRRDSGEEHGTCVPLL